MKKMKGITFPGFPKYHLNISEANPYIISGGSPGRIRKIANYLDNVELIESERGLVTVHGEYKGLPVTAFSTGMGPASVSITLPEIIEACGLKDMVILRLGTSGARRPELKINDFVITTEAERKESTCDVIMGKGYRAIADDDVIDAIEQAVNENKLPFQKLMRGKTRVVDEIYINILKSAEEEESDILADSMEFSVYCAFRDYYNINSGKKLVYGDVEVEMPEKNIRVGNLLRVSDSKYRIDESHPTEEEVGKIEETHIKSGLEALLKLSKKN